MTGGVVCYVERELGGAVIKRLRLVAAGLSRTWTAPDAQTLSSAVSPSEGPGSALSAVKQGAKWVAETVESVGLKRVAWVCMDAEGSVCAWLSAPSAAQSVIEASIMQAAQDAGAGGGDSAGLGAGRLLAMAASSGLGVGGGGGGAGGGVGMGGMGLGVAPDTSVQALATLEEDEAEVGTGVTRAAARGTVSGRTAKANGTSGGKSPGASGKKHRYAVLAVPDAPVRVLLDELDQLGIEVDGVCSFWHAMAHAWDPDRSMGAGAGGDGIVSAAGASAVVLVDPAGRLVWVWSGGGTEEAGGLLAGGTMRLATISRASAEPGGEVFIDGSATRRLSEQQVETSLQFTESEAGRLVMDWLAWSVQLGRCPRRVICLATPTLTDGMVVGPGALGRKLASAWPGATVDAGSYDDPIGATIAKLAGLGSDEGGAARAQAGVINGRSAIVPLSSRAGRLDKMKYRWAAAGVTLGAVALGALGWQFGRAGEAAMREADAAQAARLELLMGLEPVQAGISKDPKAKDTLETYVQKLREQSAKIKPPKPVIEETVRLLKALEGREGVSVKEFDCNAMFNAKVTLNVPDADTGPSILEKLRGIPGVLPWTGTVPASFSASSQRQYVLIGVWPTDDGAKASGGSGVGGGGR